VATRQNRIGPCLQILGKFGSAAKSELPRLGELEKKLIAHGEAKALKPEIAALRSFITQLEKDTEPYELRSLRD
jgi:hypothetical protein